MVRFKITVLNLDTYELASETIESIMFPLIHEPYLMRCGLSGPVMSIERATYDLDNIETEA